MKDNDKQILYTLKRCINLIPNTYSKKEAILRLAQYLYKRKIHTFDVYNGRAIVTSTGMSITLKRNKHTDRWDLIF